jgi:hypothetical protein
LHKNSCGDALGKDLTDTVVVIEAESCPDDRQALHQRLFRVESGTGAKPDGMGRKMFGRYLYDEACGAYCEDNTISIDPETGEREVDLMARTGDCEYGCDVERIATEEDMQALQHALAAQTTVEASPPTRSLPHGGSHERKPMSFTINDDLRKLIPPLDREEMQKLEASLLADGCRDALIIWQEQNTLLDGHNRYDLCTKHNLSYSISEISLKDMHAAKVWMIENQLGRQNLTKEQYARLLGTAYNLRKKAKTDNLKQNAPKDQNDPSADTTAQQVAKEYGVGEATVKRAGEYVDALDTLDKAIPGIAQDIANPPKPAPTPKSTPTPKQEPVTNGHAPVIAPPAPNPRPLAPSAAALQPQAPPEPSPTPTPQPAPKPTMQQTKKAAKTVQELPPEQLLFTKVNNWKSYESMEAIDHIGKLIASERAAIGELLSRPGIPSKDGLEILRNLMSYSNDQRKHIFRLMRSEDAREQSLATTLLAKKAPMPDPQVVFGKSMVTDVETLSTKIKKGWVDPFPYEPWSHQLQEAYDQLLAMKTLFESIVKMAQTAHDERITEHVKTLTEA